MSFLKILYVSEFIGIGEEPEKEAEGLPLDGSSGKPSLDTEAVKGGNEHQNITAQTIRPRRRAIIRKRKFDIVDTPLNMWN